MANQLHKGHQAALSTLKGLAHRIHVAAYHHSGDTVSSACLQELVSGTEARLGCRPRRRTDRLKERVAALEAKIAQRQSWYEQQQAVIRHQIERQVRLGDQLQTLKPRLVELSAHYQGQPVRPHSQLAQARRQKESWEGQLRSALAKEAKARRALSGHQQRLDQLRRERGALLI